MMVLGLKNLVQTLTKTITQKDAQSDSKNGLFKCLHNGIKSIKWNHPLILLIVIGMTLFLSSFILLWIHQSYAAAGITIHENKQSAAIVNELNDIQTQLQYLSSHPPHSSEYKIALSTITTELSNIQKAMLDLAKSTEIHQVSTALSTLQTDLHMQLDDLKKQVTNPTDGKHYIDAKQLPFHVLGLDVIASQPFVTVDRGHNIIPLTVGDNVAGWQVVRADYDMNEVEFKNEHEQYIKLVVQG